MQDACSTINKHSCGTGILPVPICDNLQKFNSRSQLMSISVEGDYLQRNIQKNFIYILLNFIIIAKSGV
ncbi:MAG: hypothetical protein EAZ88_04300 [Oscillatoriales cyanobacterium]|nr:MAG: hypothetical protein EAZ88_04300 [Oscillatoriales cyanobacterium]TAF86128.1 MAG: hypothetical protein EAZ49_24180 [Oscillatoriales cyanobacterium]TAH16021.1 MAG: hypothetical protein EAZ10_21470 [Oscillatoriales cyanobacterium]